MSASTETSSNTPQKKTGSKAGRNLPAAFGSGIIFGGAILFALLGVPALVDSILGVQAIWAAVVAVLVILGLHEILDRLEERDYQLPRIAVHIVAQGILWSALAGTKGLAMAFVLATMVLSTIRLFASGRTGSPKGWLRDTTMGIFLLAWVPLLASFTVLLMGYQSATNSSLKGNFIVLTFIVIVACSDTGGYTFGVLWGKHPIVPKVSPKKSWEGILGSLVFAIPAALLLTIFLLKLPWWVGLLLGVLLTFSDFFGDITESQFKRELGIKDMSSLIPGHGGMMDRVDGMLPSAAVTWVVIALADVITGGVWF